MTDIAILLDDDLLTSARAGRHNFIALMEGVLCDAGHDVHFLPEGAATGDLPDHSLVHMAQPVSHHGLTFRRAPHFPKVPATRTKRATSSRAGANASTGSLRCHPTGRTVTSTFPFRAF